MANLTATLYITVKTKAGKWTTVRPAMSDNGRLKKLVAVVAGKEEKHPEGSTRSAGLRTAAPFRFRGQRPRCCPDGTQSPREGSGANRSRGVTLDSLAKVAAAKADAQQRMTNEANGRSTESNNPLGIHVIAAASPFQGGLIVDGSDLFGASLLSTLTNASQQKTDVCVSTISRLINEALRSKTEHLPKSQETLLISRGIDFVVAGNK